MLYPDLGRLKIACPTGMMQAAAQMAPAPFALPAGAHDMVATWVNLTLPQRQVVIELLELDKQRAENAIRSASTMEKTRVFKAMRNKQQLLPFELQDNRWKSKPWQVVLTGPHYRYLFTAPEDYGFYGHQIGEDEPNQAKDYGSRAVYNPYGAFEHPREWRNHTTGAANDESAWYAYDQLVAGGLSPHPEHLAERDANLALERQERLMNMSPPDGADVPPAPPADQYQENFNAWEGLVWWQQMTVLHILKNKKVIRDWNAGRRESPTSKEAAKKSIKFALRKLPLALNNEKKFNSINWEVALQEYPEYNHLFGSLHAHMDSDSD